MVEAKTSCLEVVEASLAEEEVNLDQMILSSLKQVSLEQVL